MSSARAFVFPGPRCRETPIHDITMKPDTIEISRRQKTDDPDHHLWNNHGTWWLHCTVHLPDFTKWRLRKNLRTTDVQTARQLRDQFLMENPANLAVCLDAGRLDPWQPRHRPGPRPAFLHQHPIPDPSPPATLGANLTASRKTILSPI